MPARSLFRINWMVVVILLTLAVLPFWPGLVENLTRTQPYVPHGVCYLLDERLMWLHIFSDGAIGLAYVAISGALVYFVYTTRRQIPFHHMFLAFGIFIIACGITHFVSIWTLWTPAYWISGSIKFITASASVLTAILLPPLIPRAVGLVESARLSDERKQQLERAHRELAEAHQELEHLYAKSQELDELKSQFFANVSHELRTPLTLILGPLPKLIAQADDESRRGLTLIERNAQSLLEQVNSLLDLSKLEAGRMVLHYQALDLAELVRYTASHFDSFTQERGITFQLETPPHLAVEMDADKIQRVLLNLLSNAFKFTPAGGTVHCRLAQEGDKITLRVEDTGPGVPPDLREAIFERFRQAEGGATRRVGGTGLGLAIAREFAELHGGAIWVEEAPGGGARFIVRLPRHAPAGASVHQAPDEGALVPPVAPPVATRPPEGEESAPVSGPADGPLVLVIEDHPEMRQFIAATLRARYRVTTAPNGAQGLRQAMQQPPDLILSDIMMPEMSGDQLLPALRAEPTLAGVPIVLLSAKSEETMRVRLLQAGAQDYLVKPFAPDELLARVSNLLEMKHAREVLQGELTSQNQNIAEMATQLAERGRELQGALQLRDDFLSMASHELKTPVTVLLGYSHLLRRRLRRGETTDDKMIRSLRIITEQAQRLHRLILAMLDLSLIQVDQFTLTLAPVDLVELARQLADEMKENLEQHSLVVILPEEAIMVQGDAVRLEQVLWNLLQNAIRYSPGGGQIRLTIEQGEGEARLQVTDQGVGISPAELSQLFDRFYRGESTLSMGMGGMGLGLYVVQHTVRAHGGTIRVESEEGVGSTFLVTLPLLAPVPDS